MNLQKILWKEAFFMLNKAIVEKIGYNWAGLLAYFIEKEKQFRENSDLKNTKYWAWFFYLTIETIEKQAYLSRKEQETAIKKMEENLFIEKIKIWVPARNHFRILSENIFNFLKNSCKNVSETNLFVTNLQTRETSQKKEASVCHKRDDQFVTKWQTIYSINKKRIIKNNNKISKDILYEKTQKSFLEIFEEKILKDEEFLEKIKNKFEIENESLKSSAENFLIYWTEKNQNWRKEKWQMQKTFDIQKRFFMWLSNEKKWNFSKNKSFENKTWYVNMDF